MPRVRVSGSGAARVLPCCMTGGKSQMRRREIERGVRFLTFSCYRRLQLFANPLIRDEFAAALASEQPRSGFRLYAWVIMPEHVHLLLLPNLPSCPVPTLLNRLKRPFARRVISRWRELQAPILAKLTDSTGAVRFWQKGGGYDRNIWSNDEFEEKQTYIHLNPVTRGLVSRPEDWAWSSARWWTGDRAGPVRVERLADYKYNFLPSDPPARQGEDALPRHPARNS
jgi:putative transposase